MVVPRNCRSCPASSLTSRLLIETMATPPTEDTIANKKRLNQRRPLIMSRHSEILQKLLTDLSRRPGVRVAESVRMPWMPITQYCHDLSHVIRLHIPRRAVYSLPTEPEQDAGIRVAQAQHFLREHDFPLGPPEHKARIESGAACGQLASGYGAIWRSPFKAWGPAARYLKVCVV